MESRFRFDQNGGWSRTDHLIATNTDVTAVAGGVTAKGSKQPWRTERPTDPKPEPMRPRDLCAMLVKGG